MNLLQKLSKIMPDRVASIDLGMLQSMKFYKLIQVYGLYYF
jgi:hypothetical protein